MVEDFMALVGSGNLSVTIQNTGSVTSNYLVSFIITCVFCIYNEVPKYSLSKTSTHTLYKLKHNNVSLMSIAVDLNSGLY